MPNDFWEMTFAEFKPHVAGVLRGRQKRDAWVAWHMAALQRAKRMPPLKRLMPTERHDERKLQHDILKVLSGIQARQEVKASREKS